LRPEPPPEAVPAPLSRSRETPGRHHRGGAWKVAYADFVTALMALFIVLWLVNSSKAVKASVSGYFRDPRGYTQKHGAGAASAAAEGVAVTRGDAHELQRRLEEALRRMPDFRKLRNNVNSTVTGEGLRIDLMESEQGTFFVSGSPRPTEAGRNLLGILATELKRMGNPVAIEGHTDARPFRNARPDTPYGNWELAADRANTARRVLQELGLPETQVEEVRGFASRRPLPGAPPEDPRNRRISMIVRFGRE
jgi:chemotaxis protein MotB